MLFPYQDIDSRIHRLDPRPKMLFVAVLFLLSILISDILYLLLLLALTLLISAIARILRPTLGLLRYSLFIAVFVMVFNLFFSSGKTLLFQWGFLTLSLESLAFSVSMVIRLFLAMVSFSILTFAVHPDELLRTLSGLGYRVMTALSLATRMYPTIAADSGAIMDSMRARGLEMDQGGLLQRAKSRAPVIMPLLLNSLDRSIGISEAMEARGFGSSRPRTSYSKRELSLRERLMIVSFSMALVAGVCLFLMGLGEADYLRTVEFSYSIGDLMALCVLFGLLSPIVMGGGR